MEGELTLGEIYDEIAEGLAHARTKALMGEREEALGILRGASLEYQRYREMLKGYPGHYALEHALEHTMASLCAESEHARESEVETAPAITTRRKRRNRKAA